LFEKQALCGRTLTHFYMVEAVGVTLRTVLAAAKIGAKPHRLQPVGSEAFEAFDDCVEYACPLLPS